MHSSYIDHSFLSEQSHILFQTSLILPFGNHPCESGNHGGRRVGYNEGMPGRTVREALRF